MRSNLDALGGVGLAEQAAAMLATRIRRDEAFAIVSAASDRVGTGTTLRDALLEDERVSCLVGTDELDAALDPASALGAVAVLIDRALARFAEEIGRDR
jgi:adenylosuccinate lyase